jgi:hypothetical protein
MTAVLEILLFTSLIGAIDVLGFHLYRFRLYARPESAAEQVTHLARHALFLAMVAALLWSPPWAHAAVGVLFAADLLNNGIDVMLERRSRESLGGLPSLEMLLHTLSSVGLGAAIATWWWLDPVAAPPSGSLPWRAAITLGLGSALLLVEGGLFARALAQRAATPPTTRWA